MLKCCHLLSNILLLTSILILRLSTFTMVSHQEASEIAARDASSQPWMTKHSHFHVQEEVTVMQMMGGDTEVNVMEPKLWSMEINHRNHIHYGKVCLRCSEHTKCTTFSRKLMLGKTLDGEFKLLRIRELDNDDVDAW